MRKLLLPLTGILLLFGCQSGEDDPTEIAINNDEAAEPAPVAEESYQPVHTGEVVLKEHCRSCHGEGLVMNLRGQGADWEVIVGQMEEKGVILPEDARFYLIEYLDWKDR